MRSRGRFARWFRFADLAVQREATLKRSFCFCVPFQKRESIAALGALACQAPTMNTYYPPTILAITAIIRSRRPRKIVDQRTKAIGCVGGGPGLVRNNSHQGKKRKERETEREGKRVKFRLVAGSCPPRTDNMTDMFDLMRF